MGNYNILILKISIENIERLVKLILRLSRTEVRDIDKGNFVYSWEIFRLSVYISTKIKLILFNLH